MMQKLLALLLSSLMGLLTLLGIPEEQARALFGSGGAAKSASAAFSGEATGLFLEGDPVLEAAPPVGKTDGFSLAAQNSAAAEANFGTQLTSGIAQAVYQALTGVTTAGFDEASVQENSSSNFVACQAPLPEASRPVYTRAY
ncbi:MAG: hypothetical protein LBQ33_01365, partial [Oscillospiraceae bacterium]|nr:hypothetical protein [Oscillospiraceae bacterium]